MGNKMKKLILVLSFCLVGSIVSANTVDIQITGLESAGINIGNFQLNFFEPNGYEYPRAFDDLLNPLDFTITWYDSGNGGTQPSGFLWNSEDTYPIRLESNIYYATGYGAISTNQTNPDAALNDGMVVRLESSSNFGINIDDLANLINPLNDSLTNLLNTDLRLSEEWIAADHQIVTISQIPIPSTILLLGGGLAVLVGLRRRKSA
jgi:hypothetical protein